jgi:RNA polymerase sigma-70 factor (ECF subfamily)
MDDESLVRAARGGDRVAFGRLVDRWSAGVFARQLACVRERSGAEDLAQETFLRAWQRLAQLQDPRAFGAWVLAIASSVCRECLRRRKTGERVMEEIAPPAEPRTQREIDLPLAEAVAALPDDLQHLLALRHDHGLSCDEIARQLGKPLGTITKTLSRAYEQLRERLVKR